MKLVATIVVNLFLVHGILGMEDSQQTEQVPPAETRMYCVKTNNTQMYWVQKKNGSFSGTFVKEIIQKKKELQDCKKNTKKPQDT